MLLAAVALLALVACNSEGGSGAGPTSVAPAGPPCGEGVSRVELGFPHRSGPTALFTTKGGPLYLTARQFDHTGLFGSSQGQTAVFIGPEDLPPTFDDQRGVVTNTQVQLSVKENEFMPFELAAGRYWLWTSTGGGILVVSCIEGGVSNPVPVTGGPR